MASEEGKTNEAGRMRKLVELKEMLERKITDTESELEKLKTLLEFVNRALLERGFKRVKIAEIKHPSPSALTPIVERETVIPLRTASGSLLANLYVSQDSVRVVVAEGETLSVKTPPFQQFLIERVLSKMQEKDKEAIGKGDLAQEKVLSYELVLDGDVLREIAVKNLTEDRLRELKSSIHWTLEKMSEKAKRGV